MPPEPIPEMPYPAARPLIRSGDLLLFRSAGIRGKALRVAGRGEYTHAAKAVWWYPPLGSPIGDAILFVCETIEGVGGRLIPLSRYVAEYPGEIEVFSINCRSFPEYDCAKACEWMLRNIPGVKYGSLSLLRIALSHLPFIRWIVRPSTDNVSQSGRKPVCSAAVAKADRLGGGVDPVPGRSDDWCEPSELARSLLYRRKFRLLPDGRDAEGNRQDARESQDG